jgi:glutathione synthase/RimK-type ligase-like ATP-grasp enzyme
VVSGPSDDHARAVLEALRRRRTRAVLLDTARFPERLGLRLTLPSGSGGHLAWTGRLAGGPATPLDPARVGAIWWRRPDPFALDGAVRSSRWGGVYCACDSAMSAYWRTFDALWVNDPSADDAAEEKPLQLALAHRLGLAVPRSCITNDPAAARAFIRERPQGETIHKNVTSAPAIGRNTRIARAGDRALLASIRHLPLVLQERVPAAADVRVTAVGEDLFPAEIDFPRARPLVDWRSALHRARLRPVKLPHDVERKVRRLVAELGLVYAAIDLRRRPDGEHVFLEVNPGGQFLFVEERTGQPITAALADLLARGRAAAPPRSGVR